MTRPQHRPPSTQLHWIKNARVPTWVFAPPISTSNTNTPCWVDIEMAHNRVVQISPSVNPPSTPELLALSTPQGNLHHPPVRAPLEPQGDVLDVQGRLVIPGLVDAHTHLDKTLTLSRLGEIKPGLLNAIESMMKDRATWSIEDIQERSSTALSWAFESGVVHLRSHCDWWEARKTPLAWGVLNQLAAHWSDRLQLDRVNLIPLTLFADLSDARVLGQAVIEANTLHPGASLGGFIHTTNWNPLALKNLMRVAHELELDLDLHVDEELNPNACGLESIAREALDLNFKGRIVCGHTCALAQKTEAQAHAILQAVKAAEITLVSLPVTNMILQDAQALRTPRLRGLTLVKEAQAMGIPVLMASDNVQDPFCPVGSYDPIDALNLAVPLAQLPQAFDLWSQAIGRRDWLVSKHTAPASKPLSPGEPAHMVIFEEATTQGFPSRSHGRHRVHHGHWLDGGPRG